MRRNDAAQKNGRIDTVEFVHVNFATGCNQVQQLCVNGTVLLESMCHTLDKNWIF